MSQYCANETKHVYGWFQPLCYNHRFALRFSISSATPLCWLQLIGEEITLEQWQPSLGFSRK